MASMGLRACCFLAGLHLGMNPKGHGHPIFPHIMDMSIHLDMDLRNRSCQPCTPDHPLGPQCCGMCGFWENLRYKNVERQPWVAPCNIRDVSRQSLEPGVSVATCCVHYLMHRTLCLFNVPPATALRHIVLLLFLRLCSRQHTPSTLGHLECNACLAGGQLAGGSEG